MMTASSADPCGRDLYRVGAISCFGFIAGIVFPVIAVGYEDGGRWVNYVRATVLIIVSRLSARQAAAGWTALCSGAYYRPLD